MFLLNLPPRPAPADPIWKPTLDVVAESHVSGKRHAVQKRRAADPIWKTTLHKPRAADSIRKIALHAVEKPRISGKRRAVQKPPAADPLWKITLHMPRAADAVWKTTFHGLVERHFCSKRHAVQKPRAAAPPLEEHPPRQWKGPAPAAPLVMAHYMPWYESKPVSGHWGWHWTMNHFDPDKRDQAGREQLASQFRPLIGPYDSSDPDALECQTLQMKIAGIDGVLIDWYGTKDLNDYAILNRNSQKIIDACARAGLKYSVVIEDQVVPQLVKAGKSSPDDYAKSSLDWLKAKWFSRPGYLRWNGKPVLLIFGPQFYKDPDLTRLFGHGISLFTLLGRRGPAVGAFGWPEPQVGDQKSWTQLHSFYDRAKGWSAAIGVAYPRFEDIYKEAKVGPGYGEITDRSGTTFQKTLSLALGSKLPFVQIATWNDWGEGTQIEPSAEFGYRDLEVLQQNRRKTNPAFPYHPADLRLPARIYQLRKQGRPRKTLNQATQEILTGQVKAASRLLRSL